MRAIDWSKTAFPSRDFPSRDFPSRDREGAVLAVTLLESVAKPDHRGNAVAQTVVVEGD